MPVTVIPSNAEPRAYNHEGLRNAPLTPTDLFKQSCPPEALARKMGTSMKQDEEQWEQMCEDRERKKAGLPPLVRAPKPPKKEIAPEVHFSSWERGSRTDVTKGNIYASSDSFIRGAIDAWAQHQHFVLRPDEVWFAILVQVNFYMRREAESVRDVFVSHQGQEDIYVESANFQSILLMFKATIQKRVKTEWLEDWIVPNFSTTEARDILTANVLMMGMVQRFFNFGCGIICGLPSVTLLGEKKDWEKLLTKLDRLPVFGKEPAAYAGQLQPILSRFVQTFDAPDDPEIRGFWDDIVNPGRDYLCGAPPYFLQGWLAGFFFWDDQGKTLSTYHEAKLELDGIRYTALSIGHLPVGYAKVPLKIKNFEGQPEYSGHLVAGNLGKEIVPGVPEGYAEALNRLNGGEVDAHLPHGIVRPLSGWMYYGPTEDGDCEKNADVEKIELYLLLDRGRDDRESSEDEALFL